MITNTDILVPCAHVAYRKIAGQVVIVQPLDDNMLTLNETGSEIWGMLEGDSVLEIAEKMATLFDVSREEALADTKEFLSQMINKGLVEPRK